MISIIFSYLFFIFALVKFKQLLTRHNPQILEYKEAYTFGATDEFIPGQVDGFMVAIGFIHMLTGEPLNDPRYVKWVNAYGGSLGGVYTPTSVHNL